MEHLTFVIWLLGFPIAESLSNYIDVKAGKKGYETDKETDRRASFVFLLFKILIAALLY